MSPATVRVKRNDATIHMRANFLEASLATQMGLRDAITELKIRLATDPSLTPGQRAELEARIAELERRLARTSSRQHAFMANRVSVRPPSAAEVRVFRDLSDILHQAEAQSTAASTIVSTASKLFTEWNRIS